VSSRRQVEFINRPTPSGRQPASLIGLDLFDVIPIRSSQFNAALERVAAGGADQQLDIPIEAESGATEWYSIHLAGLPASDDGARGVLFVAVEVTETKQSAIELRMSVNALHRMIEARDQLAADLHDGILQALFGVGLQLEALGGDLRTAGLDPERLRRAIGQLNDTMKEIRRFIAGSQSALPGALNWEEALVGTLHGLGGEGGPKIEISVEREVAERVPADHRGELLLIAREAVSNAVRHAGASRILVRLHREERGTRMEIEDNGKGFATLPQGSGLGLLTMTRRAGRIGATLRVQSDPNTGTLIRVDLAPGAASQ
jgi:signal transduction histidine kinase